MVHALHLLAKAMPFPEPVGLEVVFDAVAEVVPAVCSKGERGEALAALQVDAPVLARHVGYDVVAAESSERRQAGVDKDPLPPGAMPKLLQ